MKRLVLAIVLILTPLLMGCPQRETATSARANPDPDAARYEVVAGPATALNGTQMALVVRIDRATGKSWVLKQQKLAQFGGTTTPEQLEALEAGMSWEWTPIGDPPDRQ